MASVATMLERKTAETTAIEATVAIITIAATAPNHGQQYSKQS